ncbi:hypothetical protein [Neglectibacter sp. X4]|nr:MULTISPECIES: hypothetical protein [unclassified Neglectibacter]
MRNSAAKIQMTGFDDLFGPSAEPAGGQFQEIALLGLEEKHGSGKL